MFNNLNEWDRRLGDVKTVLCVYLAALFVSEASTAMKLYGIESLHFAKLRSMTGTGDE